MKFIFKLGSLATLSLLINVAIQWLILVYIGPGEKTDAYFSAQVIILIPLTILGDSVIKVLAPLLAGLPKADLRGVEKVFVWQFFLGFTAIAAALIASASIWVSVLYPGLSVQALNLTIDMARIMSLTLIFVGMTTVLKSAYHAEQRFIYPEFSQLIASILVLLGILYALPIYGIVSVAWGTVIRWLLHSVILFRGKGWHGHSKPDQIIIRNAWRRIRALLYGASIYKTGPLVDRYLASLGPAGSISLLVFGHQLYTVLLGLIDIVVAAPFISVAAAGVKAGQFTHLWNKYLKTIVVTGIGSLAVWAIFILLGRWLLELFLGYGKFDYEQLNKLWMLMAIMGGLLVAGVAGQVTAGFLYALGETTIILRIAIINFFICILIKVFAFKAIGLPGIAIGIVTYQLLNAIAFYYFLNKVKKIKLKAI